MLNILCVEDDYVASYIIHEKMERMGYTIIDKMDTGEDALKLCEWMKPDVILMDIKLAGEMDGIETAQQIQKTHNIPVIFITGINDDQVRERALATNPHDFFTKPLEFHELQKSIEKVMSARMAYGNY